MIKVSGTDADKRIMDNRTRDSFDDHPKGEDEEFAPQIFQTTTEILSDFEFLGLPDKGTEQRLELAERISEALCEILGDWA